MSSQKDKDSIFGKCPDCEKERSSIRWCKYCEIDAIKENFKSWTSGNLNIDDFIKQTQLNATGNVDYLEFIDFEQFDLLENTNKGGAFSTIYSAIWLEGPRWIWDEGAEQWTRNGPTKVALKRLNNSHNISEQEYLKHVSYDFNYFHYYIYLKFNIVYFNHFHKVIKCWKRYGLFW